MELRWLKRPVTKRVQDEHYPGQAVLKRTWEVKLQVLRSPFEDWQDVPTVEIEDSGKRPIGPPDETL